MIEALAATAIAEAEQLNLKTMLAVLPSVAKEQPRTELLHQAAEASKKINLAHSMDILSLSKTIHKKDRAKMTQVFDILNSRKLLDGRGKGFTKEDIKDIIKDLKAENGSPI